MKRLRAALAVSVLGAFGSTGYAVDGESYAAYDNATWYFQCPTAQQPIPDPTPTTLILDGAGPHYQLRGKLLGTPITVKGSVCTPDASTRDLVFVIDVSGSMAYNDPKRNGTCGRFEALTTILDKLPQNLANIGLLTFDEDIGVTSSKLYSNKSDLYAAIAHGNTSVADIVCDSGAGTLYSPALNAARNILKTGRKDATKEVFFITDGEPSDPTPAEATATDLKTNGVTIDGQKVNITLATIMLGSGNDSFLKDHIASQVPDNSTPQPTLRPVHGKVANAADLADMLDQLAGHIAIAGIQVKYRPMSDANPTTLDGLAFLQADGTFELPTFELNIDGHQIGYEVTFDSWDSNGNHRVVPGKLFWID